VSDERTIDTINFDVEEAANPDRIPQEYRDTGDETVDHKSLIQRLVDGLFTDKKALTGLIVVVAFILIAVFAPSLAPHDPGAKFDTLQPPMSYSTGDFSDDSGTERVFHLLGTDSYGHDILSRIIFGSRISLAVAMATMLVALVFGTALGLIAAYYGGWIDNLLMRIVDFQWAFPELILAVGIIAFAGGRGFVNVVLAIGIAYIDDFARLVRGEVLSIREQEYILAARSVGMHDVRILTKEVLPNAIAPLIVQATIMIPLAIIASASLSFLGLGVSPTTPAWGILINSGRDFITRAPWISIAPGIAIAITVLGFNLLGDGLRDIFDISEGEVKNR
jgi:peptide/nickel transport system permease protein